MAQVSINRKTEALGCWGNFTGPHDLLAALIDVKDYGFVGELQETIQEGDPLWRMAVFDGDGNPQFLYLSTVNNHQDSMQTWMIWDGEKLSTYNDADFQTHFQVNP